MSADGNGATPATLAQQVAQLRSEVEEAASQALDAKRFNRSFITELAANTLAVTAQKTAVENMQASVTGLFGAVEALSQKVEQLAAGVQVLVDRKSIRRRRRG